MAESRREEDCIAEGHWTTVFDTETNIAESFHDPDDGPCEFPVPKPQVTIRNVPNDGP